MRRAELWLQGSVAAWHGLPAILRGVLWAVLAGLFSTILNSMLRWFVCPQAGSRRRSSRQSRQYR